MSTSLPIPTADHGAQVIPLRPLHRQLKASVDILDLGAAMRDAGTVMMSAGTTVMQLNEMPTEHMIRQLDDMGWHIVRCAAALAVARAAMAPVPLPADCEPSL